MNKVALSGIAASSVLFLIYITVVSLVESFTHATEEFLSLSYLMIPLIAGFGLQVSLFMYSMHYGGATRKGSVSVGASGGLLTALERVKLAS